MSITTVGTMLINDALPEDMRKEQHVLDKKGVHKLFMELAEKHPEKYGEVLDGLADVGKSAVWTEGASVSLAALRQSKERDRILAPVKEKIRGILLDKKLSDADRRTAIVDAVRPVAEEFPKAVLAESLKEKHNPYAMQVSSGAKGSASNIASLKAGDLLVTDQHDQLLPVLLDRSYAEGLTPAQYFATSYGQRRGALDVKMSVAEAGYGLKRLVNAAHRQVVTKEEPTKTRLPVGLPVDTKDKDNVGAVLAKDAGQFKAGTILTPAMLERLKDDDVDEIVIHSPMTEVTEDGGLSKLAAGRRTRAGLHQIGDNIGVSAAQSIGERLSQGLLGSKHRAGVGDIASRSGMQYINRLIESPEHFPEAGPLLDQDGQVEEIRPAPQGGTYVVVNKKGYYLNPGLKPVVKIGDQLEQGDDLSDGVPHPRDLVKFRGLGEARRVYLKHFKEALDNSGATTNRRNAEATVSGLLNWARITNPDGYGGNLYDDIVPANKLSYDYKPRSNAVEAPIGSSIGKYLEEPALHYTPGTRITKKVAEKLKKHDITTAYVHPEPPDFEPEMIRSVNSVFYDPDWKTRLAGFYAASAFQKALHRGATSDTQSTSYFPALSEAKGFGKNLGTLGKYGSPVLDYLAARPTRKP